MISDVLDSALSDIDDYQRRFPQCYDDIREEIEAVKRAMKQLSDNLWNPFGDPHGSDEPLVVK